MRFIVRRVMLLFRFIDKHAVSRCVVSVLVDGIFTWFMGLVVMLTTDTLFLFCGKVRYVLRVKFKMNRVSDTIHKITEETDWLVV